jgi:hypothetical protein
MKRLLINCNFCYQPNNCTLKKDVAVIVEVEDDEVDIAYPLRRKLISLNYDVYPIETFKETTRFTSQIF